MTDPLSLTLGRARVDLSPGVGGAIAGFTFDGIDVLRPTPAAARAAGDVRAHACYPLVPYSNRIANARLALADRTVELARNFGDHPHSIHGVGWQRAWRVAAHDDRTALLTLEHAAADADARAWPWPFRVTEWFALAEHDNGATLTARLALVNTGRHPFPFGLGFHPFFPRTAATALAFDVATAWESDATLLPIRQVGVTSTSNLLAAGRDDTIDNVFSGWKGVATLTDPAWPFDIGISADRAAGFAVVYAPAGRDFVAVEPVTHMTDAFNRAARGDTGTGARNLAAGAGFSCTIRIFVQARP